MFLFRGARCIEALGITTTNQPPPAGLAWVVHPHPPADFGLPASRSEVMITVLTPPRLCSHRHRRLCLDPYAHTHMVVHIARLRRAPGMHPAHNRCSNCIEPPCIIRILPSLYIHMYKFLQSQGAWVSLHVCPQCRSCAICACWPPIQLCMRPRSPRTRPVQTQSSSSRTPSGIRARGM